MRFNWDKITEMWDKKNYNIAERFLEINACIEYLDRGEFIKIVKELKSKQVAM